MATYNDSFYSRNYSSYENNVDSVTNKVYINPNFTRASTANIALPQKSVMHINPKFSQTQNSHQNVELSKTRIYVNPNFVNLHKTSYNNKCSEFTIDSNIQHVSNMNCNNLLKQYNVTDYEQVQPTHASKSRYCLVRHNKYTIPLDKKKINNTLDKKKINNTIQVNRYKKVQVKEVKKRLETVKLFNESNSIDTIFSNQTYLKKIIQKCDTSSKMSNAFQNKYKLIKNKNELKITSIGIRSSVNRCSSVNFKKNALKSSFKTKTKTFMKKFKINNIPCPLFKKYGKCLRKAQGNCEFLHDKKHVSICRKFLKGICHDKECLLSHELTTNKMPTCYFYLKGMCTKEDCPYLHVKLNEKAKICIDFLKGYCEKGDKCLNRHITVCPELALKGVCLKKRCIYTHKFNKNKNSDPLKVVSQNVKHIPKSNHESKQDIIKDDSNKNNSYQNSTRGDNISEGRYYKVTDNACTETELIKPSRCKLGSLPSFIQL